MSPSSSPHFFISLHLSLTIGWRSFLGDSTNPPWSWGGTGLWGFLSFFLFSVSTRMEIDQIKVSVIGCHLGGGRGDTCMLGKVFFYQVLPTYIWLIKNNHCFQKVHNGIFSSLSFLYVLYRGEPLPKLEWVRMAGEEKVESKSSPSFFQSSFSLCQELFMLPCAAREPSVMFGFFTQPTDVSTTNLLT